MFSKQEIVEQGRSGCIGLRVDTGRWEKIHLDRRDGLCLVCRSAQHVEDEHHFLFDYAVYRIQLLTARLASLFQQACSVSNFFTRCAANDLLQYNSSVKCNTPACT